MRLFFNFYHRFLLLVLISRHRFRSSETLCSLPATSTLYFAISYSAPHSLSAVSRRGRSRCRTLPVQSILSFPTTKTHRFYSSFEKEQGMGNRLDMIDLPAVPLVSRPGYPPLRFELSCSRRWLVWNVHLRRHWL